MSLIHWLEDWYLSQCDGDWEHTYGIQIKTIDNPGWSIQLNLVGTYLEHKKFQEIKVDRTENDWFYCKVTDGMFTAAGGPKNLSEILIIFKEWSMGDLDTPDGSALSDFRGEHE